MIIVGVYVYSLGLANSMKSVYSEKVEVIGFYHHTYIYC